MCIAALVGRAGAEEPTTFQAQLTIRHGRLAVDTAASTLRTGESFRRAAPQARHDTIRDELARDLDRALARVWGEVQATCREPVRPALCAIVTSPHLKDGPWSAFLEAIRQSGGDEEAVYDGYVELVTLTRQPLTDDTPLYMPESRDDRDTVDEGTSRFMVADPVATVTGAMVTFAGAPDVSAVAGEIADVLALLRPFEGRFWRADTVRREVARYFAARGLWLADAATQIEVSKPEDPRKRVTLYRLHLATIAVQATTCEALEAAVYSVLPDRVFRPWWRTLCGAAVDVAYGPDARFRKVDVRALVHDHRELLLTRSEHLRARVGEQGFTVELDMTARGDGTETPWLHLLLTKPRPVRDDADRSAAERVLTSACPATKNYARLSLAYVPDQGVRASGLYRCEEAGPGQFEASAGNFGELFAALRYELDYVAFGTLGRRLSLRTVAHSLHEPERRLAGREVDERRSGGLVAGELEWFRDRGGALVRTGLELEGVAVRLRPRSPVVSDTTLAVATAHVLYAWERAGTWGTSLLAEPSWRLGATVDGPARTFGIARLSLQGAQGLGPGWGAVVGLRVEHATDGTPLFEQPSLGGEDTVRGIRRDAAIGRTLWSVQPELLMPIWLPPAARERLGGLSDTLRTAVFLDVGAVDGATGSRAGVRAGPGLGLRLRAGIATLKLDLAYGLGPGRARDGGARFYVGVDVATH